MINPTNMYLLVMLDNFRHLVFTLGVLGGFISAVFIIISCICAGDNGAWTKANKWFMGAGVFLVPICLLCILLTHLTPSTKQAAVILGVPLVANSEMVQGVAEDAAETVTNGAEIIKEVSEDYLEQVRGE